MKTIITVLFLSILSLLTSFAHGWGNLGHRTVAILAQRYLAPEGASYAKRLLNGTEIDAAATWPDEYKNTPEGRYTGSWHFVDAMDEPPTTCNVVYKRDCQATRVCIITALKNMTDQLLDPSLPQSRHAEAFKFVLHLMGDMHMPLHADGISRGGNDITVLFDGIPVNLHFAWDVSIPQKRTRSNELDETRAANDWAKELYDQSSLKLLGMDAAQDILAERSDVLNLSLAEKHALEWAADSNTWVCKYVLKDGQAEIEGKELSGAYYVGALPILDELITTSAKRLALWINSLAIASR